MSKFNLYTLIGLILISTNACSENNAPEEKTRITPTETVKTVNDDSQKRAITPAPSDSKLISKAKQITADYKLSPVKQECLTYEVQKNLFEGKRIIDVREVHSKTCGGDSATTPRLFTIAIVEATGEVWSDAKSMLGQLEKLGSL